MHHEGEPNERFNDERSEPEIDDAGRAWPRPRNARTQAPLAPLCDEPDDGWRLRRRTLGPLRRLWPRRSWWTGADVYAATVHRGNAEGLARPGARNGTAGGDRLRSIGDRTGLISPSLPIEAESRLRLNFLHRMALVKTILVVDDEPQIVTLVRDYLEHGGFTVFTAADGPTALRTAFTQHPDLVVLDLGLPGIDGLDVTRSLRRNVTVPFSPKELVARIRSVLRRSEAAKAPGDVIRVGDVELIVSTMELTIAGRRIELTPTEFQLLATMVRQPGRVFSRAQLLNAVHGDALEAFERAIDAHIKNLRRKIEPDPHNPQYLLTVFGVGYRFADARR